MTSPAKLKVHLVRTHMRVYKPSTDDSPDTWSGQETTNTKVGDIYIFFVPAPENILDDAAAELEISAVALVFREDAFFPMNYLLDEQSYEMSFLEGVLSSKASEAREAGCALYCLRASMQQPLNKALVTALASMERTYGGSGERKKDSQKDPLFFFLESLGIEIDPAFATNPISISDLARSLWFPARLAPGSKIPALVPFYASIGEEEARAIAQEVETESAAGTESDQSVIPTPSHAVEESYAVWEMLSASTAPAQRKPPAPKEPATRQGSREDSEAVWDMLKPGQTKTDGVTDSGSSRPAAVAVPESAVAATTNAAPAADESDASESEPEANEDRTQDQPAESAEQPVRKTMSLQATLERLEEQKRKAYNRLDEFKNTHETACSQGLNELKERYAKFEEEFTAHLKDVRKAVIERLRLLSTDAEGKLATIVNEGRTKSAQLVPEAIAELDSVRKDREIAAAFAGLQSAADEFAQVYATKLSQLLECEYQKTFSEQIEGELSRLAERRSGSIVEFEKYCSGAAEQVKKRGTDTVAALEKIVNSMVEELDRLKELDVKSFSLMGSQLLESADKSRENAEMRLRSLCDKALARQILPFLTELRTSLTQVSHELRQGFVEQLEQASRESLAGFDRYLDESRKTMQDTAREGLNLKDSFEADGKLQLDERLSELSAHLKTVLDEFKNSFKSEDESGGAETRQTKLLKRAEQLRLNVLSGFEESSSRLEEDYKAQTEKALAAWKSQVDSKYEAKIAELAIEIEQFKSRRQDSQTKIDELVKKHTDAAEAVAAAFIQ